MSQTYTCHRCDEEMNGPRGEPLPVAEELARRMEIIRDLTALTETLQRERRALKDAVEDFGSCAMSDDPGAEHRARAKLRTCYLRYCLAPETRKKLGWLLPEDARPS